MRMPCLRNHPLRLSKNVYKDQKDGCPALLIVQVDDDLDRKFQVLN